MKTRWILLFAFMLLVGGCSGDEAENRAKATGGSAERVNYDFLDADLTEDELTARVPLVAEARVVSVELRTYATDPDLPANWRSDPDAQALIESGARSIVWRAEVERWIKGTGPSQIFLARSVGSGISEEGDATSSNAEELSSLSFGVDIGLRYLLWLRPDPVYQGSWYIPQKMRGL